MKRNILWSVILVCLLLSLLGPPVNAEQLETYKGRTFDEWKNDLNSEERPTRRRAIVIMGMMGNKDAVPLLVKILEERHKKYAPIAMSALKRLEAKSAISAIIKALDDKDPTIKTTAISILGYFKAKSAVPFLIKLLQDDSKYIRGRAMGALANIGPKNLVSLLIKVLQENLSKYEKTFGEIKVPDSVTKAISDAKQRQTVSSSKKQEKANYLG